MLTTTECIIDQRGQVQRIRGEEPDQGVVDLARGLLLLNRASLTFLYRQRSEICAVRFEREPKTRRQASTVYATVQPMELPAGITPREVEVLTLVAAGLSNKEISARLGNSARTVSTQIERLLAKLGQRSRAGLAALTVDGGLMMLPIPGGTEGAVRISPIEVQRLAELLSYRHDNGSCRSEISAADPHVTAAVYPTGRRFVLGTLAPLLGAAVEDGRELVRGASMAVEEINEHGGIGGQPVEHIVVETDMFDPDSVKEAMLRLLEAGVDAITTTYVSAENPFLLDLAADAGVVFLHLDAFEQHVQKVASDPHRYGMIFQTCPSETNYSRAFTRFLRELRSVRHEVTSWRRVGVIELDSQSTQIADADFQDALEEQGWDLVHRSAVKLDGTDWVAVAERVLAAAPDILLVAHFIPQEAATLQLELAKRGFSGLTHHVYGAANPAFARIAGEASENVTFSSVTFRTQSETSTKFHRDYAMRYREEPGPAQASAAFDQVQLLAWAWRRTGTSDQESTCAALREEMHLGLNGVYFLGNPGQSPLCYPEQTRDPTVGQVLIIAQIQQGKPVVLSPEPFGEPSLIRLP